MAIESESDRVANDATKATWWKMEVVSNILLEQGTDDKLEQEEGSFSLPVNFFLFFIFFFAEMISFARVKANLYQQEKKKKKQTPTLSCLER